MKRYLVVANQTAAGPALQAAIVERVGRDPAKFHLVVPATHPRDQLAWAEGTAYGLARQRMNDALEQLRAAGADIEGWVGDENPYRAIRDALSASEYDEVVLSTFPASVSRWLKMDIASRVRAEFDVPIVVVESDRVPIRART